MICYILRRCSFKAAGNRCRLLRELFAFFVCIGFCNIYKFSCLNRLKFNAKCIHKFAVQGPSKTEPLRSKAYCSHFERFHSLPELCCRKVRPDCRNNAILFGRSEAPYKRPVIEGSQSICRTVCACKRIGPESASVYYRLSQCPEQHRRIKSPKHLSHVRSVGKCYVLKYYEIRSLIFQIFSQFIN